MVFQQAFGLLLASGSVDLLALGRRGLALASSLRWRRSFVACRGPPPSLSHLFLASPRRASPLGCCGLQREGVATETAALVATLLL
jgi:hypothetical protein